MERDNKFSYFFLGLGIGVAVGILFAPKSGAETRELLKERAEEGKEYVKRRSAELRDSAVEAYEKGKEAVVKQKEQLAAAVEAGKAAYREKVQTAQAGPSPADDVAQGI